MREVLGAVKVSGVCAEDIALTILYLFPRGKATAFRNQAISKRKPRPASRSGRNRRWEAEAWRTASIPFGRRTLLLVGGRQVPAAEAFETADHGVRVEQAVIQQEVSRAQ